MRTNTALPTYCCWDLVIVNFRSHRDACRRCCCCYSYRCSWSANFCIIRPTIVLSLYVWSTFVGIAEDVLDVYEWVHAFTEVKKTINQAEGRVLNLDAKGLICDLWFVFTPPLRYMCWFVTFAQLRRLDNATWSSRRAIVLLILLLPEWEPVIDVLQTSTDMHMHGIFRWGWELCVHAYTLAKKERPTCTR